LSVVVDTWPHRGNVELYFKHRYSDQRRLIGALTSSFAFADSKAVLRDLRRMRPKGLAPVEQDIFAGRPAAIEQAIAAEQAARRRAQAIREGMQAAAARGVHVGRPPGAAAAAAFLAKPTSQRVRLALDQGLSVRKAAQDAHVSANTVRKVAALRDQAGAPSAQHDTGAPAQRDPSGRARR
jgi:hypothetical protein